MIYEHEIKAYELVSPSNYASSCDFFSCFNQNEDTIVSRLRCFLHLSVEYFPKATDDNISVWEDESIAFDVLANDYFAGNNASIVTLSKVSHEIQFLSCSLMIFSCLSVSHATFKEMLLSLNEKLEGF